MIMHNHDDQAVPVCGYVDMVEMSAHVSHLKQYMNLRAEGRAPQTDRRKLKAFFTRRTRTLSSGTAHAVD